MKNTILAIISVIVIIVAVVFITSYGSKGKRKADIYKIMGICEKSGEIVELELRLGSEEEAPYKCPLHNNERHVYEVYKCFKCGKIFPFKPPPGAGVRIPVCPYCGSDYTGAYIPEKKKE